MCLTVADIEAKVVDGKVTCFKVVRPDLRSLFTDYQYKIGVNEHQVFDVKIIPWKPLDATGLHVFLNMKDAAEYACEPYTLPHDHVYRCEVDVSDIVARGLFIWHHCLLVKKLNMIERVTS